jgi:hypothetical protein
LEDKYARKHETYKKVSHIFKFSVVAEVFLYLLALWMGSQTYTTSGFGVGVIHMSPYNSVLPVVAVMFFVFMVCSFISGILTISFWRYSKAPQQGLPTIVYVQSPQAPQATSREPVPQEQQTKRRLLNKDNILFLLSAIVALLQIFKYI